MVFLTILGLLLGELLAPVARVLVQHRSDRRIEYFVIEDPGVEHPAGILALRELQTAGGQQLERDVDFMQGPLKIREVVNQRERAGELVWRALGPGQGRTWMVQWGTTRERLTLTSWGLSSPAHSTLPGMAAALTELELLQLLRNTRALPGEQSVIVGSGQGVYRLRVRPSDPLLQLPAAVQSEWPLSGVGKAMRSVDVIHDDGVLFARYVFVGTELIALQFQAGERWARRVDESAYDAVLAEWPRLVTDDERRAQLVAQFANRVGSFAGF